MGRVRSDNEDRFLMRTERGTTLLAVADGVGGEEGGEVASAAAVESLGSTFDFEAADVSGALAAAMRAANDAVLRACRDRGVPHAATTLVAAAIRRDQAAIANLGDSRAYLVGGGAARQVTADHSGLLPGSITRFVGDPRGVSPDVFVEPLGPGERLVLCSDGLTVHVRDQEIAQIAASGPLESAVEALVALANERGGEDNVTVVLYDGSPPRPRRRGRLLAAVALLAALALAGAIAVVALGAPR